MQNARKPMLTPTSHSDRRVQAVSGAGDAASAGVFSEALWGRNEAAEVQQLERACAICAAGASTALACEDLSPFCRARAAFSL